MSNFQVLQGDCIEMMRTLPDNSINCCVTSPPYFGLRDYGCDGQIGLEETPDAFIANLVSVFREVKRVLKDDGTLWVNMGDSYAAQRGGTSMPAETLAGGTGGFGDIEAHRGHDGKAGHAHRNASKIGLKHKDLIGIPWMLAFALRADGWYLRQDIIWHKPNPMPESVTDRCTKAHEYIFLLTKSPKYYFDHKAMQEKAVSSGKPRQFGATKQEGTLRNDVGRVFEDNGLRNKRSVWSVNVKPYKEAHFATYPPELITPCILSGCPECGTVLDPFGGSGTTAQVALQNKRNAILCELNPEYVKIIEKRLASIDPLFNSHE
jgi:site-specific DNA-methyltransferase (adenine-specific)